MKATSRLFSSKECVTGFVALRVRLSSKSQLLQKVPGQRIWKVTFIFDLGWEPCKQACPQKQTSANALVAKTPATRNMTTNMLNFWRYPIKVLPSNLRVSSFYAEITIPQHDLHLMKVFGSKNSLTYSFGIFTISQFHWLMSIFYLPYPKGGHHENFRRYRTFLQLRAAECEKKIHCEIMNSP